MKSYYSILFASIALVFSAFAHPTLHSSNLEKRNPTGSFSLYAYQVASNGIKLFYADGLAYLGDSSSFASSASVVTDVTFTLNDTYVYTTATTEGVTLPADTLLYIRPDEGEILPVGFTNSSTPSDAVTSPFLFYGAWIMWETSSNELLDSFYAKETDVSGVYQLFWNTDNANYAGYVSAVIRDIAPSS